MEIFFRATVLLVLMVQLCYSLQLGYKNCGSSATIKDLDITPCESDPCTLHRGQSYSVNLTFVPEETTKTAKTVAHALFALTSIPLNVAWDSCNSGHLACPIEGGKTVTYSNTIEIAKLEPLLGFEAKWEIQDDKGEDMVCFMIPLKIGE